jgi:glycerophosphoryl diester phosphodiesterase
MPRPLVIAHRGASTAAPENSLAALRAAGPSGADGVELDVRATADGALVLHHDPAIGGGEAIARLPLRAVRAHRLGNGEPVPTLEEALAMMDGALQVFVELKDLGPEHDQSLLDALARGPHPERYAIHSFDHRIVRRVGERRPALSRGVLSASYPLRPLVPLEDAGATTLWQEHPLVDRALVELLHGSGRRLIVWTVDQEDDIRRFAALGVDGITTNRPDVGRRVVDAVRG